MKVNIETQIITTARMGRILWEETAMELTYTQNGDYQIPNLKANEEPQEPLLKYGEMRRKYLKENYGGTYSAMLLKGTLRQHCLEVQNQAQEMLESLEKQMRENEGVNEALKASDQMEWVRRANSIRNRAEEIVLAERVYSL